MPAPRTASDRWPDDRLDALRLEADLPADTLVEQMVAEEGEAAARELFHLLIRNIGLPLETLPGYVRNFVEETGRLPDWADAPTIQRGQKAFLDFGVDFVVFLYYKSLPTCYACWRGAQVLHLTGRLDQGRGWPEIYARRVAETAQFVLDVMTPGNLAPGGRGIRTAQKVRLIHAAIRRFLPEDRWDAAWGRPINQEDMALTLMTFSVSMLQGLAQARQPLPADRAEAYLHAWRVVGHLLGLQPALLPRDGAEGEALLHQILDRQAGPSEAGQDLTRALITFVEELVASVSRLDRFAGVHRLLVQFFVGGEHARMLGVRPVAGCLVSALPAFLKARIAWRERLEDHHPDVEALVNGLGRALIEGLVRYMRRYKGEPLHVPALMQQRWSIQG